MPAALAVTGLVSLSVDCRYMLTGGLLGDARLPSVHSPLSTRKNVVDKNAPVTMSYYEPQSWQLPMRQGGWPEEEPAPPSRSGASSAVQREDMGAFHTQVEEVDRAIDNLAKSGKLFSPPSRRDSMPMVGSSSQFSSDYGEYELPSHMQGVLI